MSRGRLAGTDPTRFFEGSPDAAIEVLSPSERPKHVRAKVAEYLAAGTQLVLVADPLKRELHVHRSGRAAEVLGLDELFEGGEVLPGLQVRVARIFGR